MAMRSLWRPPTCEWKEVVAQFYCCVLMRNETPYVSRQTIAHCPSSSPFDSASYGRGAHALYRASVTNGVVHQQLGKRDVAGAGKSATTRPIASEHFVVHCLQLEEALAPGFRILPPAMQ